MVCLPGLLVLKKINKIKKLKAVLMLDETNEAEFCLWYDCLNPR